MRISIFRTLGALSIATALVACSGTTGAATRSPATPAPTLDTPRPTAAAPSPTATAIPEATRVGVLAPGSYRYTQREPAVTFTVPKDWVLTEAMSRHFGLRPAAFVADNSVRTWYDMRVASRDPSCPETPDPAFGHTAAELLEAFRTRPGVVATEPEPIALGGLAGHWIDVRVDEAWTETCPFTGDLAAATLFTDDLVPDDPAFWGLGGYDERMRMVVLDDGAGSNVIITVDAVDAGTFGSLVVAAMPVIETFAFER